MKDKISRREVALFRLAVLGDLIHAKLRRGARLRALKKKATEVWLFPDGKSGLIRAKTIESWLTAYRQGGIGGLMPRERKDKGLCKAIPARLQDLILAMKREDRGRSVPMILRELAGAGQMRPEQFSASSVARLLRSHGLSGPRLELETQARYRFVAATCNDLWQGDACHGPKLFDKASGRDLRVKIFGLLDDKSRLVTYLRAGFHERPEDFLRVLLEAVQRRGIPRAVLLDNHGSFTGSDTRIACAQLGIRLVFARPYDGPGKGKIERFWRTLRAHVLDRLDMREVTTLDDLNVRLMTWVASEYNQRPHAGISARTPLSVFEEDAGELRFVDDPAELESAFEASLERLVKNDATCSFRGRIYEVPPHLRRRKVMVHYKLLRPEVVWIEEGGVQVLLREVDAVANAKRSRKRAQPRPRSPAPRTGLNAIEDLLRRKLHPRGENDKDNDKGDTREEGSSCARS